MSQKAQRQPMTMQSLVYRIPGMDTVTVRQDVVYRTTDAGNLTMNIYYPIDWKAGARMPAVVFVIGYSDLGAEAVFGCKFQEMESYIAWARLAAAAGLVGITYANRDPENDLHQFLRYVRQNADALGIDEHRIGVWSCSGNVPLALSVLMQSEFRESLKCAALFYGYTLDLEGASAVADAQKQWRFANAGAGNTVSDLPQDLPLFVARAGHDENPGLNETLDRFLSHALASNLPITIANHPTGPHAFDLLQDSETSREIIRQTLAFLRFHLLSQ